MAMEAVGINYPYELTEHARKRVIERLGIRKSQAESYINQLMQSAYLQGFTSNKYGKCRVYDHYKTKTRIIVDDGGHKVITVYKFAEPIKDADIRIDFLRPVLEREKRKIDRYYTRAIRRLELRYAETLQELADAAMNRARAKNPQTRELIADRMNEKRLEGEQITEEIERMSDDWKAKVRAIEVISE